MRLIAALIIGTSLGSGTVSAMTVTYNSNSHTMSSTNWTDVLNFTQFDASFGTLTSIKVTLGGNVIGTAKGESEDNGPTTIVLNLGAKITLTRPDNTKLVIDAPTVQESFNATAFDGVADYAGTSGVTYTGIQNSLSNTATLTSAADLALFTGTGTVAAPVTGVGNSSGSGAGNLDTQFRTQASATGSIEYTFAPGVPEPASWALMIAGFCMVGIAARRRKPGSLTA